MPSSERIRKPLIVSLIVLLVLVVGTAVVTIAGKALLGGGISKQTKQAVYQRSTQFITSVYQDSAKQTFGEFMSSPVKKTDDTMLSWNRMVKYLHQDKLVEVLPYGSQKGQFYKDIGSSDPNVVRYGVKLKLDVRMSGQEKPVIAQLEWIKEQGKLKLFLIDVPYAIAANGNLNSIHYGLKHYTVVNGK